MYVLDRGGGPCCRDEFVDACPGRVGIEYPDEYRTVKRRVSCQPFVDVTVAAQPDLGLVAIR
jgi:hypothetical protein